MIRTLSTRIIFIVTIFSAFGYILSKLVVVKNSSFGIAAISMILALMTSFIFSLFLISKLTLKRINKFIIVSVLLFFAGIATFYQFQSTLNDGTIILEEF